MHTNALIRGLVAGSLIFGLAGATSAQDIPTYEGVDQIPEMLIRFSDTNAPTADAAKAPMAFVDYVEKATNGRVTFEMFWSNALFTPTEAAEGVASGIADMASILPHFTPATYPINNWLTFIANDAQGGSPFGHMVMAAAATEFLQSYEPLKKEFEDQGIHLLGASGRNAYDMMCTSPVKSLADAAGKRTRTGSQSFAKEVTALGMVAIPTDIAEVYEAFSRGILDCVVLGPDLYITTGVVDVPRDLYWINIEFVGFTSSTTAVNKAKWDSFPPVLQRIFNDAFTRFAAVQIEQVVVGTSKFGQLIKDGKIKGVVIDDDFQAAANAHQENELKLMAANAPPGVENPQQVVDDYLALIAKWRNIVTNDLGISEDPKEIDDIVAYWQQDWDLTPFSNRLAEELAKAKN